MSLDAAYSAGEAFMDTTDEMYLPSHVYSVVDAAAPFIRRQALLEIADMWEASVPEDVFLPDSYETLDAHAARERRHLAGWLRRMADEAVAEC